MMLLPCPVGQGEATALRMAHRLGQELAEPVVTKEEVLRIDADVGTAIWRGDSTLADAMGSADVALYQGRHRGQGDRTRLGLAGGPVTV
jgi:GGDEF domain-containing protein